MSKIVLGVNSKYDTVTLMSQEVFYNSVIFLHSPYLAKQVKMECSLTKRTSIYTRENDANFTSTSEYNIVPISDDVYDFHRL